jgi:hypothetical protein
MGKPHGKRNTGILLTVLTVIASLVAVILHGTETVGMLPAIVMVGLTLAIAGIAYTIKAQLEVVRYNRLMRGEDLLVRWLIEPDLWRDFLKLNEQLNTRPGNLNCTISDTTNDTLRNEGIPVMIGKVSLMIAGDFQSLPVNGFTRVDGVGWFEGSPPYLEFLLSARGKTATYRWAMRTPVPAGAEADARIVHDYYQSRWH